MMHGPFLRQISEALRKRQKDRILTALTSHFEKSLTRSY